MLYALSVQRSALRFKRYAFCLSRQALSLTH